MWHPRNIIQAVPATPMASQPGHLPALAGDSWSKSLPASVSPSVHRDKRPSLFSLLGLADDESDNGRESPEKQKEALTGARACLADARFGFCV